MRQVALILFSLGIFVAGISVAYYFGYVQPKDLEERRKFEVHKYNVEVSKEAEEYDRDMKAKASNENKRTNCLAQVQESFSKISFEGASREDVKIVFDLQEKRTAECHKLYPVD